ncbi:uncharacterized protein LOC143280679 [Babylonia areolata]|uniref:uncharacterized protein LOC143280679 n=1 Tax=Babylonia areolata TaxID=304850 RepID=UPI003FD5C25B
MSMFHQVYVPFKTFLVGLCTFCTTRNTTFSIGDCFEGDENGQVYDLNPGSYNPRDLTGDLCAKTCGAFQFPRAAVVCDSADTSSGSYSIGFDDVDRRRQYSLSDRPKRTFHLPGVYTARVEAVDIQNALNIERDATTVTVEAPVADVTVDCDAQFMTYEEGECVVTVWQGTSLSLTAVIRYDAERTFSFPTIRDPTLTQTGPGIFWQDGIASSFSPPFTVLALGSAVLRAGRIIGWELHVSHAGWCQLQILSPKCPAGTSYCRLSNECASSCSATLCDDSMCDSPTPPSKSYNCSGRSKVPEYEVTSTIRLTFANTGYHYLAQSTPVNVLAGDVVALVYQAGSGRVYNLTCPLGRTDFILSRYLSGRGARVSASELFAVGMTSEGVKTGLCMALRATVSEASYVHLPFTFYAAGRRTLDVSVSNRNIHTSTFATSATITVVEAINVTIIQGPTFVQTGTPNVFSLAQHSGASSAKYTWDVTDGSPAVNVISAQSWALTYATKGTYHLNVTIANAINSKSNRTVVHVQDEVTGLNVTAKGVAALGEPHAFQISLAGGSNYTCLWSYDDGSSDDTTDEVSTPSGDPTPTTRHHSFSTRGSKSVIVTCANDVSLVTSAMTLVVQERIRGLRLSHRGQDEEDNVVISWQVESGSDVHWAVSFNGNSLQVNYTASGGSSHEWRSEDMGRYPAGINTVSVTGSNDVNSVNITQDYEVTVAVAGFRVSSSPNPAKPGDEVAFTVNVDKGKDVNITLVYSDGDVSTALFPGNVVPGTSKTFRYRFFHGGRHLVKVLAGNVADTQTASVEVLVNQGVDGVQMVVPPFVLFSIPFTWVDVWFTIPEGAPRPTDPRLTLKHFLYEERTYALDFNRSYSALYFMEGVFSVTATVSNLTLTSTVAILDILEEPIIRTAFPKAPRGQPMDVYFSLSRGPKAPFCNLTWDFGNHTDVTTTERKGGDVNGSDKNTVTYWTLGTYVITVTATTPMQTVSKNHSIQVIEPVPSNSFNLTFDSPTLTWDFSVRVQPFSDEHTYQQQTSGE